jgi:hypothetical protein
MLFTCQPIVPFTRACMSFSWPFMSKREPMSS